jgi:hypothetical protein
MTWRWILKVSTVGFVSVLLCGTVALGQAKAKSGDVAHGKTWFAGTAPVVTDLKAEGMGTDFLVDRIRLTSHHRRPERNPMQISSGQSMRVNRICRLGVPAFLRKRAETCWPMCGPSPSERFSLHRCRQG